MLSFEKEQQFSPGENKDQVEAGFTPPGSYSCVQLMEKKKVKHEY